MPVIQIIVILVVIGVLMWAINQHAAPYIWAPFLKLINAVVIVAVVLWLLGVFLGWSGMALPLSNGPIWPFRR
jgi:hypothetical protein